MPLVIEFQFVLRAFVLSQCNFNGFSGSKAERGGGGVPVSPLAAKLQVCKNAKISELELWLRGGGGSRRLGMGTRLGGAGRGYRRWFFGRAGGGSAGRAAAQPGCRGGRTSAPRFLLLELKLVLLCEGAEGPGLRSRSGMKLQVLLS